jgi:hypothetical protein
VLLAEVILCDSQGKSETCHERLPRLFHATLGVVLMATVITPAGSNEIFPCFSLIPKTQPTREK